MLSKNTWIYCKLKYTRKYKAEKYQGVFSTELFVNILENTFNPNFNLVRNSFSCYIKTENVFLLESWHIYLHLKKNKTTMQNEILVLDIETTGLSTANDFILELGIVKLNTDTGEITELFDKIFKDPNLTAKHRRSWIFENGFMDIDEVRTAKPLSFYADEIQEILNPFKGKITAWNRSFDQSFLKSNGFDLGSDVACPMKISTQYFKIKGSRGFKWPKAQEAWDILFPDTHKIEAHRGLDDSIMEAKIIFELVKMGVYTI